MISRQEYIEDWWTAYEEGMKREYLLYQEEGTSGTCDSGWSSSPFNTTISASHRVVQGERGVENSKDKSTERKNFNRICSRG
jgi:hypothetical protein